MVLFSAFRGQCSAPGPRESGRERTEFVLEVGELTGGEGGPPGASELILTSTSHTPEPSFLPVSRVHGQRSFLPS